MMMATNKTRLLVVPSRLNMILLALLWLFMEHMIQGGSKDCYQALSECEENVTCKNTIRNYAKECGSIVDIYTNANHNTSRFPCSDRCVNSIKALMRLPKGKILWKCDCNLDAHCLTLKTRTQKCLQIANGTYRKRTGCSGVLNKCMMDTKCRQAQMDFLRKCSKLFSLTACTTQCLCSQKKLFGLPKGRLLMDCECDGLDELYCLGMRAHADSMNCNWKNRRSRRRLRKRCKKCKQRRNVKCKKPKSAKT